MKTGEVWQVNFPYEDDINKSKPRPAIILDIDDEMLEVLSIKVTTHKPRDEYDIPIFKWKETNLPEPSYARVSKVQLLKKESFIRKFGELDILDFKNIVQAFKKYHSK